MAKLKITITSEHRENDRRFLDIQLAKFRDILARAGFLTKLKLVFEPYAPVDTVEEIRQAGRDAEDAETAAAVKSKSSKSR